MEKIRWEPRYSSTNTSDKQGRWARLGFFGELLIIWINRISSNGITMYQANTYFPVNEYSDCPTDHSLYKTYAEAEYFSLKKWEDFVNKINHG